MQPGPEFAPPRVVSQSAKYTHPDYIEASYAYSTVDVTRSSDDGSAPPSPTMLTAETTTTVLQFRTLKRVPRVGVLLVGLGGNNGTTVLAGLEANRSRLQWRTKTGVKKANWYGSLMLSSTTRLGRDRLTGEDIYVPLSTLVPVARPEDLIIGGWDISGLPLGDAMRRAQVLDLQLQDMLFDKLQSMRPMAAAFVPHFVAANQADRADNILSGSLQEQLEQLRADIRNFRTTNKLDTVIVLWSATTERYAEVQEGVHDTAENWLQAIRSNHREVSASGIYATAAILEGCSYINGSPQNTFVPGLLELADRAGVFLGGDDFKSGQTKLKSVLVDFLVSAGLKPASIVSYNHLGNNDGQNLSSPEQFRSKEISKSTVVDDMIQSNPILYSEGEAPDHCVVIKYVPFVGDSKRALDEYSSEIFLGGINTIAVHNTCEDSLLAAPIIIDLVLLTELCQRIRIRNTSEGENADFEKLHTVLSILSYLCKAPLVPHGTPVVNALAPQRQCIVNMLRACIGLGPDNPLCLEHKLPSMIKARAQVNSKLM